MIPDEICTFLEEEASVAMAATRDEGCVPSVHRVSGWRVEEDRAHMWCLFPGAFLPGLLENLEQNGQLAVTIEQVPTHQTYQFKGDYVESGPPTAQDLEASEALRQRFGSYLEGPMGLPPAAARAFTMAPELAVRFAVREIFLQTPGPDAGRRLVPAEEA